MESVACNLCGADQPQTYFQRSDRFSGRNFQFVCCQKCGLVYLNPRPEAQELAAFYPPEYECYATPERGDYHARQARLRQVQRLNSYSPQRGRLLDVGCATGEFLAEARAHHWQVQGVELTEQAAATARKRWELEVFTGALEAAPFPPATFDAITLWDVLEHLPSPNATLRLCRELLKPGGVVLFSIPNLDSFDRHLFGSAWIGWDAPRHFNLFDSYTASRLLQSAGFHLLGKECFLGAKGAFFLSLEGVTVGKPYEAIVRKATPLLSALLWPYRQLSYKLRRGPIITYIAQKPQNITLSEAAA